MMQQLKSSFDVPAPPEKVWTFFLDVKEVVSCMPGAELTEVLDDENWRGRVAVRLGPVSLSYSGTVAFKDRDDTNRCMRLKARGTEARGKGTATAEVTCQVTGADGVTHVDVTTILVISGAAAQFGRGMLSDVSQKFADEFAQELASRLVVRDPAAGSPGPGQAAPVAENKPIAGLRLVLWAFFRSLGRGLLRLFQRN